jgi:putative cardiolipin synthase
MGDTRRLAGLFGRFLVVMIAAFLTACAGLPQRPELQPKWRCAIPSDTVIARELAPQLAAHPGESVFYPLAAGTDAFAMRIALARVAQRSLDIQYYIYETDDTGLTLQPPSWPRQIVACGCSCCSMTSIWPGRTRCCR